MYAINELIFVKAQPLKAGDFFLASTEIKTFQKLLGNCIIFFSFDFLFFSIRAAISMTLAMTMI